MYLMNILPDLNNNRVISVLKVMALKQKSAPSGVGWGHIFFVTRL